MLDARIQNESATEVTAPTDVLDAVARTPMRPSFLGLPNTTMGAPSPDRQGIAHFAKDLMPRTGLTLLGAQEGCGKSLISCSLAAITAIDKPGKVWCDYEILVTGRSFIVMGEGLETMHKARFEASLRNTFKYKPADAEYKTAMEKVEIFSVRSRMRSLKLANPDAKIGRRLFVKDQRSNSEEYVPSDMLQAILAHIKAVNDWADAHGTPEDRIVLVIFDTLQSLFGVKLMDDEAINDVIQFLNAEMDALGCCCIVTAHTNKSSTAEDDDPRGSIKGSQQLQATVESVILLRQMTKEEFERTRKAGMQFPFEKALAIKPGKANGRDADRTTKLLMGLRDGAPVGITEFVADKQPKTEKAFVPIERIKSAVLKLWWRVYAEQSNAEGGKQPKITTNMLYGVIKGVDWNGEFNTGAMLHGLSDLVHVGANGSGTKGRQMGTLLNEAADAGFLEIKRSGATAYYHPGPRFDEEMVK